MDIELIPSLSDNYIYLIIEGKEAFVVDPAEAKPVEAALKEKELTLKGILCTHHHADHVGGVSELKEAHAAKVYGPDDSNLDFVDQTVGEGDSVSVLGHQVKVFHLPGHTKTHIAFYFPDDNALFCGDVIFAAGCGRLLEGTPMEMFGSLNTILELPDATKIYCGHEYTVHNLNFAKEVDPKNKKVVERLENAEKLVEKGKPTLPTTLKEEKETNPFLRYEDQELRAANQMENNTDLEVFTRLREKRDSF